MLAASTPTPCATSPASRSAACRRSATPPRCAVFVDPDLLAYDEVWAAAGTWNDVFGIAPADLVRASGGTSPTSTRLDLTPVVERRCVSRRRCSDSVSSGGGGSSALESSRANIGVDGDEQAAAARDDRLARVVTSTSSPVDQHLATLAPVALRRGTTSGRCSGVPRS